MSPAKKAVAKILMDLSDADFDFSDLCLILDRAGFTAGSDNDGSVVFSKYGIKELIIVQPNGNHAKPYQVKQVRELIRKYRLASPFRYAVTDFFRPS